MGAGASALTVPDDVSTAGRAEFAHAALKVGFGDDPMHETHDASRTALIGAIEKLNEAGALECLPACAHLPRATRLTAQILESGLLAETYAYNGKKHDIEPDVEYAKKHENFSRQAHFTLT